MIQQERMMMEISNLKCPKCGSDCYVWFEGDITAALEDSINKKFAVYCLNDCGIVGSIRGVIMLKKRTLKMDR